MNVLLVVAAQVDEHAQKALAVQGVARRLGLLRDVHGHLPVGGELADAAARQDGRLVADAVQHFAAVQIDEHSLIGWRIQFFIDRP